MKREKRLTKRERKAIDGVGPSGAKSQHAHCVACGRHLDPSEFESAQALRVMCAHRSSYACCAGCESETRARLREHDESGQPVKIAPVWH